MRGSINKERYNKHNFYSRVCVKHSLLSSDSDNENTLDEEAADETGTNEAGTSLNASDSLGNGLSPKNYLHSSFDSDTESNAFLETFGKNCDHDEPTTPDITAESMYSKIGMKASHHIFNVHTR